MMAKNGGYKERFAMLRFSAAIFFCLMACAASSRAEAADNSQFDSQSVPDTMTCFRNYTVSVTMKNTGTTTWTQAGGYNLGSYNPYDNWTWGLSRVPLSSTATVCPGESKTFTFTVTAPGTPGTYNFQWQMVKDGVGGAWFGAYSTNRAQVVSTVTHDALFVSQSVPANMVAGQPQSVSVTMKNIGSNTWTKAANYKLGSQNPHDNLIWGFNRVELAAGDSIAFGQPKTFTFTITFPPSKGPYQNFQWRMLEEGVKWFGDPSTNLCVSAPDRSVSVGGSGAKVEDMNAASAVIDNFNDNGLLNIWGGETGAFFDGRHTGDCVMSNSASAPQEGAYSLRLDFDVINTNGYSGYYSRLQSHDIRAYTALSFYVKGAVNGEFFKVELKSSDADVNHRQAAVYITDYLEGGVTTSWQQVTIPLHNFANIDDWTASRECVFTFENFDGFPKPIDRGPEKGQVYIDNVALVNPVINVVRVDHFGDQLGLCALGGNMGTMFDKSGTCLYGFTSAHYVGSKYSLQMTYNVNASSEAWSGVFMLFGGGDNGWTAVPHDFSAFNYIRLDMRGGDVNNPKVVKIELVDSAGRRPYYLTGITNTWQFWLVPLSNFSGLNKATIKQMNFVFENGTIGDYGGAKSGDLYVDRIQFEK